MEYILELPEPYKTLAMHRREQHKEESIIDETMGAFEWHATPEEHDFWSDVYNAATADDLPAMPQASLAELRELPEADSHWPDVAQFKAHPAQAGAKPRLYLSPQALFEYLTDKDIALDAIGRCVVFSTPEGKALQATEAYIDANDNIHLTIQN